MKPIFIAIFCLYILSVFGCLYFTNTFFIPRLKELCDPYIKSESESDKKGFYKKWKMAFISFSMIPIINFLFLTIFVIKPLDSTWNDFVGLIKAKFGSIDNFIAFGLGNSDEKDDSN